MSNKINFAELRRVIVRDGVNRRAFAGKNSMLVMNEIQPSAAPRFHSHPHEQLTYILQGECDFFLGDEIIRMSPGDIVLVPPNVEHALRPVGQEPILNLDVFSPVREDYLA